MALSQAHLALCLSFPSLSFFIDLTGFYEAPEALQVTVTSFLPSIRQRTLIEHILCACICVERGLHAHRSFCGSQQDMNPSTHMTNIY